MKTAAFFGTDGGVSFAAEGFEKGLKIIGDNTGNMLFQHAMWKLVPGPKILAGPGALEPSLAQNVADVLVVPAANQINPNFRMDAWADYLEAADLPCVVVGLGAQADDPEMPPEAVILTDSVTRFARIISKRSRSIGVRGEFTRKVLKNIGIYNTTVTGCPSQMINMRVTGRGIQASLERAKTLTEPAVALLGGTLQEYSRKHEHLLYSFVKSIKDHAVIYQTQPSILRFVHDRSLTEESRKFLNWMNGIVRPDLNSSQFFHYLSRHGRYYSDARTWIDSMRRFDVAVGMRIHGAVAAIQAGRLGICVAFDSRTLELSRTMGMPYVRASEVLAANSLSDVLEMVHFDAAEFDEKRAQNVSNIRTIMRDAE